MAECDKTMPGAVENWSIKRITMEAAVSAAIGAALAAFAAFGGPWWGIILAAALGAVAGAGFGFWMGNWWEWFHRLKEHDPKTITIAGRAICVGKNVGVPPFHDNDWNFNIGGSDEEWIVLAPTGAGLTMGLIRTLPAPGAAAAFMSYNNPGLQPILHTEIGSHIGDYSAAGGGVGTAVGTAAAIGAGLAACVWLLGVLTFGLGAAVCAVIAALVAAAGSWVGGFAGNLIGGAIGWIADALDDFDHLGKTIEQGCLVKVTGTWVTDRSHQLNEIHDVESIFCIFHPPGVLPSVHSEDIPPWIAAVGIGRKPAGDPVIK